MSDQEIPPAENVIKGPWKENPKRKVKIPDENIIAIQENLAFADHLTEQLMVQMIHTMSENGFDVRGDFGGNMAFIIEAVKGTLYRGMGMEHPINNLMDALTSTCINSEDDNLIDTEINFDILEYVNSVLEKEDDDGPEVS
jgi:hypothetical protein